MNKYRRGDYYVICDICGLQYYRSECKKNWKQQIVCKQCYESKHPQLDVKTVPERMEVADARPPVPETMMVAADVDAICESQSASAAEYLVLDGDIVVNGEAIMDLPRPVSITSVGDDTGITFTVNGINAKGIITEEVITGGSAAIVYGTTDFKSIRNILTSGATAGNITVGTAPKADVLSEYIEAGDVTVDDL